MVVTLAGQLLALVAAVIIASLIQRAVKLDFTLSCVATGFLAGQLIPLVGFDTGIRAWNLQEIVFFFILPVLIFEASWHIKPSLLKRWLLPVFTLATVGVLVSCYISAGIVFMGVGHFEGFPWIAALLTGSILAATDPVAVIGQLRSQNAPEDLTTLFEGESLFNDASAVVLFSLFLSIALQADGSSDAGFLGHFAAVFFGGILLGLVAGLVSAGVVLLLNNAPSTVFVLLFTAFGSFYVAEHLLHVSGIMAVMFSALVLRWSLAEVEDTVAAGVGHTWDWLGQLFNGSLFVLMGLVITVGMFTSHWLAMLIAIAAAVVARAGAVGVCSVLIRPLHGPISRGWQILLIWGGLRGAIAVALVLALPVELDYWYTVQSMVFGVVLFSLLVQGTTNSALIRKYGGLASDSQE
jgi:CPA1 family monovalent cation:H+ antiporter